MINGTKDLVKQSTRKKIFAKLGYNKEESAELVTSLNLLIANYSVLYQKLRNFHWNVKGADFFDVHEKFEEQYNYAQSSIDNVAERIRVFGHTPLSTLKDYLDNSEIEEADTDIEAMEMVKLILADYRILMEKIYGALEVSIEIGDSGTEDLLKDMINQIEEYHWMLTAFSS